MYWVLVTPERRKDKRLVHVNLLKEYHSRKSEIVNLVVPRKTTENEKPRVGIQCLLQEFEVIFADVPQPSPIVTHDVELIEDASPVK
ncbi:hypothetical protein Hamer_G004227 [Homarus americanus]|uniref:Uncharacterized protein n=1 Tax=Homarus americanus TaxID=6706 RepID=A0A8J5MQ24_HOMAM|nr:hypothetical protein Hamer_G004227 [Homarus americanus]